MRNNILHPWFGNEEVKTLVTNEEYLFPDYMEDSSGIHERCVDNTNFAVDALIKANKDEFLATTKTSMLDEKDPKDVLAYIGEVRCFGFLVDAFCDCEVNKIHESREPATDFYVKRDKQKLYIEVNTMQKANREDEIINETVSIIRNKKIVISEVQPTIFDKKDDMGYLEKRISKICGIKNSEKPNKQFKEENINVLWIDLQTEDINNLELLVNSKDVIIDRFERYNSNILWYADYAEAGMHIIQDAAEEVECNYIDYTMKHNGRFFDSRNGNVSGVVYAFSNYTVLHENPFALHKLPKWCIDGFKRMRNYSSELSIEADDTAALLEDIAEKKKLIEEFASKKLYCKF